MNPKTFTEFDNHEKVLSFDLTVDDIKVPVFIALHRIRNGIAIGGTRIVNYSSKEEALKDALNLSKGMTYKCVLANIQYGGGKGVIFTDPEKIDMTKLLTAYAKKINELNGAFYTGEDVGISAEAVEHLGKESKYIVGRPSKTGIPAPWAALGVFEAMKASLQHVYGSSAFKGRAIAIKGIGAVGSHLAKLLLQEGAEVYAADIRKEQEQEVIKKLPKLQLVPLEKIHTLDTDIYAPCALGYDLTEERVRKIKSKIICGSANNQLANRNIADVIYKKGIVYIPDYVANAGGLIHVVDELMPGGYSKERVKDNIFNIQKTVTQILDISEKKRLNQVLVAEEIAATSYDN